MRLGATGPALVLAVFVWSGAARADRCESVYSSLMSALFVEGCTSPVAFCTRGTVATGRLAGTFQFTALTSAQPDPTSPLIFYTGVVVYTTRKGTVTVTDSGVFNALNGAFFELQTVIGASKKPGKLTSQGTGIFARVGGATQLVGFKGSVAGRICDDRRRRDGQRADADDEGEDSVAHRDGDSAELDD
jgi:hypothetical protein